MKLKHTQVHKLLSLHKLFLILINLTSCIVLFVHSYNLDSHRALCKRGDKGSYFGFSIAQHATLDTNDTTASSYRSYVIVGAPRDSPRSLTGAVRPGAVYRCDFSLTPTCQLLDIDSVVQSHQQQSQNNQPNEQSLNLVNPPGGQLLASAMHSQVIRDNQWLGVSVKSQGINGYAVACAHRHVLAGTNYRWAQGVCYSLTKNLNYDKTWQPCFNRPVNRAHEEHGYCQAGISSDISNSSDIVLGAPGPYTWRGTVFTNSIGASIRNDRTWYHAPMQDDDAKVDKYSYLGMSVISGKFFNNQEYFVSGAPRAKDVGQVHVMSKQNLLGRTGDSVFRVDQILEGEQIASSFGYTIAKLDFNGDGLLDLVVGSPFYYNKTEGGAVYAYTNDGKSFTKPKKLTGKVESRFGIALANCGDLNHDKYEDLAVGAPHESPGGAVYIYFGSTSGLKQRPSQIIKASHVGSNLQTFGYSLTGGLDMDRNGYPDLVVGSYADDSVYILRARPIIQITTKIEGNLTKIDANRATCDGEKNQLPCFKFNTCFELDPASLGEYSDVMKIKYRIEAETFAGLKYSRVKFHDAENTDTPDIVEKEITIEEYSRRIKLKRCSVQKVYIRDRSDIQTPIQFKLTYSLVNPNRHSSAPAESVFSSSNRYSSLSSSNFLISSTNDYCLNDLSPPFPILNQEEAERIFSARFLKDCGSNDICESHLDVDGQLQAPLETVGINEPSLPSDKQINVTVRVSNLMEPAYEAKLYVKFPTSLSYSSFKATNRQLVVVDCMPIERNLVKCDVGNPMTKGTTKLTMVFDTHNRYGTFDFNLMVNTTSQNAKDAKTSYNLSGTINKKPDLVVPNRPHQVPEPLPEPPTWLLFLSIILGLLLFLLLFYCLYINGFFDRPKAAYTRAATEEG